MIFPPKSRYIRSAAALSVLAAGTALACGPFFPSEILTNRNATLKTAPRNSFAYEASHLVAKGPGAAVEPNYWEADQARKDALAAVAKAAVSPAQEQAVTLYADGAQAFHAADLVTARKQFAAVLALPADQARPRLLMAAYSLGRADALSDDRAAAAADFTKVRALATPGVPDPLGLAVASLGEEARLHFHAANALLVGPPPAPPAPADPGAPIPEPDAVLKIDSLPPGNAQAYGQEMRQAVALYARQAAYQSDIGVQSLRTVAANIVSDPARLDATIADPLVQKLVASYALDLDIDLAFGDDTYGSVEVPKTGNQQKPVDGTAWIGPETATVLDRVIDAVMRAHIDRPAAADRLAAVAYRTGRFDLAAAMAAKSNSALAEWVKAKLSLQAGDPAAAQAHYAAAVKAVAAGTSLQPENAALMQGESGAVALARSQFMEALRLLYGSRNYWTDSAYIAERVLTTDELKSFVDANVPAPAKPSCDNNIWQAQDRSSALRDLLARRLMRDGRTDDAMPYFCLAKTRALAQSYAADLRAGHSAFGQVARARALYQAAVIARQDGMEIMGTEGSPDYAIYGGDYDPGTFVGRINADKAFIPADERRRAAASTPSPDLRFHYRYVAALEAQDAAGLLPPRSQAFAAVLCNASGWMLDAPDGGKRGWQIYQRYVREGAYLKWPNGFGRKCPDPDFGGATLISRSLRQAGHALLHHRKMVLVAEGAAAAGLMALLLFFAGRRVLRRT